MARQNGRDLRIKRNGTVIAVVNTKTINVNNTPVDVTGDDDAGFITVLERPGTKQISADVSGFTNSDALRDVAILGTGLLEEHTIEWLSTDGLGTVVYSVTGDFYMGTFSETGASDGGLEFSATLTSSGAWTKDVLP
jgi:predicted secreted protein